MVWPAAAESLKDIPMGGEDRVMLQVVNPRAAAVLCEFVANNSDTLEAITGGNEAKEAALGSQLAKLAHTAFSACERDMRGPIL